MHRFEFRVDRIKKVWSVRIYEYDMPSRSYPPAFFSKKMDAVAFAQKESQKSEIPFNNEQPKKTP